MKKVFIKKAIIPLLACCLLSACLSKEQAKDQALTERIPEIHTSNKLGRYDGYDFEFWMDNRYGGAGSMTLNGGGAFSCEWNGTQNILFRMGKKFDTSSTHEQLGNIVLEYGCDYQPNGNSYLCVYGWTVEPLIEFYVVESWGSWRPPGAVSKGVVEIDGGIYDIYETMRTNQPSIQGTQTFRQYFSVRRTKKTEGIVSVSDHFRAWENMGMELGRMYEVALCVEGYMSSGTADVHTNTLTIGGIAIPFKVLYNPKNE